LWKEIKKEWNVRWFLGYVRIINKVVEQKNYKKLPYLAQQAIKHGKRVENLSDSEEEKNKIKKLLSYIEELSKEIEKVKDKEKKVKTETKEEKELRLAVKKQYVSLGMNIIGGPFTNEREFKEFIAREILKVYEIARGRLNEDKSEIVLRMIYVNNRETPGPLREVIKDFLEQKISKEKAQRKIKSMESKVKEYLKDLKISIENIESPKIEFPVGPLYRNLDSENKLRAELIAEAMKNDGEIDQVKLFILTAEIYCYPLWIELSKEIDGRNPTAEELIDVLTKAIEQCHRDNPNLGFKTDEEFRKYLQKYSARLKGKERENFYAVALPAYQTTINMSKNGMGN